MELYPVSGAVQEARLSLEFANLSEQEAVDTAGLTRHWIRSERPGVWGMLVPYTA